MPIRLLVYLTSFLLLVGCSAYMENHVYKQARQTYEEWSKPNKSILDIKKALLECGLPTTNRQFDVYEKALNISRNDEPAYMNQVILEDKCLEQTGYIYHGVYNTTKLCAMQKYLNLPACQPMAIPAPSIGKRLNSWHCKVETDHNYCLEYSLAPQLCSLEKTKTPPLECLSPEDEKSRGVQAVQSLPQT